MPASYLPYEPDQDFLLPPSMREWLPDGHLAFFLNDTVEALDLTAFHARYDKGGPRKIAAKLHEDDDRKPRGKDGKPKGGRYKREFGKPEPRAQENFTDADSRIMKRAGGGFDPAYNAQLAAGPAELVVVLGREGKQQLHFDPANKPHTAAMAAKLQSEEGKAAYRKRKWIAEPPNGWIKNVLGFRQFSLRGLHRVQAEWKLLNTALNLRRMCRLTAA